MIDEDANRAATEKATQRPSTRPADLEASALAALHQQPSLTGGGSGLRRAPLARHAGQPARPADWPVAPASGYRPNVDNVPRHAAADRRPQVGANVDNLAGVPQATTSNRRASVNVDIVAGHGDDGRRPRQADPNVDNAPRSIADEDMPAPRRALPSSSPLRQRGTRTVAGALPEISISQGGVATPTPGRLIELRREFAAREAAARMDRKATILGSSPGTTRTPETMEAYEKRSRQLVARYRRELDIDPAVVYDPREFAAWFISLRPSISSATWRSYKQAVLYALTAIEGNEAAEAVRIVEADSAWDGEMAIKSPKKRTPVRKKNSANKAKTMPFQDYEKLDAHLRLRVWSRHAQTLRDWLRAGIATGLRPDEWQQAEVVHHNGPDGERIYLFVLNAKSTNGRANGVARTLDITDFTEETYYAVVRMAERGHQWFQDKSFDSTQSQCAQMLYRANESIWKRREATTYALYTCRHQFILNMRAADVQEAELSAMLGHLVTETQMEHYGKRGKGWSIDKILDIPKALKEEVATVRRTLDITGERMRLEAIIGKRKQRQRPDAEIDDDIEPSTDDHIG